MKALLIDDERLAREALRGLLEAFPEIQIVGEASKASEALSLITSTRPDIIFLDVEMPGQSGFDLLGMIEAPHPNVVFVTAYDTFALRAFDVNAIDYLQKPVSPDRLAKTLSRILVRNPLPTTTSSPGIDLADSLACEDLPFGEHDKVFIRDGARCWFIPLRDIRLIEQDGNFTKLYFDGVCPAICRQLHSIEARLPKSLFFRANRSQLVNLRFVEKIEPWFSGGLRVTLSGGVNVDLSRRQAVLFRTRLKL